MKPVSMISTVTGSLEYSQEKMRRPSHQRAGFLVYHLARGIDEERSLDPPDDGALNDPEDG